MLETITHLLLFLENKAILHNVNPYVFTTLYLGSIPPYAFSIGWLLKNKRSNKPLVRPLFYTGLFFILPAAYLVAFGKGIPFWIYGFLCILISIGLFSIWKKLKKG